MDMNEAIDILGTQCQKMYTKNMVKALSMCTWLNNDKAKDVNTRLYGMKSSREHLAKLCVCNVY